MLSIRNKRGRCALRRLPVCLMSAITAIGLFASTAFAAESKVFGSGDFAAAMQVVFNLMRRFGLAAFAIGLVVCSIVYYVGNEKNSEFCKSWAKRILVAVACLALLPTILYAGFQLFENAAWNPDVSKNGVLIKADDSIGQVEDDLLGGAENNGGN